MKLVNFIFLFMIIAASAGLYQLKHTVALEEADVVRLTKAIHRERESIRILQAEWSYLSQPKRLQKLARKLLTLRSPDVGQHIESKELIKMCLESHYPDKTFGDF